MRSYGGRSLTVAALYSTVAALCGCSSVVVAQQIPSAREQNNLGIERARQGKNAEAEKRFREAIRIDPAFTQAYLNLAQTLAAQGRFPEAEPVAQDAARLAPAQSSALTTLAMIQVRLGRSGEAIANFRKV